MELLICSKSITSHWHSDPHLKFCSLHTAQINQRSIHHQAKRVTSIWIIVRGLLSNRRWLPSNSIARQQYGCVQKSHCSKAKEQRREMLCDVWFCVESTLKCNTAFQFSMVRLHLHHLGLQLLTVVLVQLWKCALKRLNSQLKLGGWRVEKGF